MEEQAQKNGEKKEKDEEDFEEGGTVPGKVDIAVEIEVEGAGLENDRSTRRAEARKQEDKETEVQENNSTRRAETRKQGQKEEEWKEKSEEK